MMVRSSGWWLSPTPLKKIELVSWDDDIPDIWKNKNVPNHQPVIWVPLDLISQYGTPEAWIDMPNHKSVWNGYDTFISFHKYL